MMPHRPPCPACPPCCEARPIRQRGFAIVGAFFLVVVLAALGLYLSRFTAQNQAGSALDIQGARAYEAARTGMEWAAWRVLDPAAAPGCFAATTLGFPDGVLQPFTVTIGCSAVVLAEAGENVTAYQLIARACNQPPCAGGAPLPGYVDRQVEVTVVRR
jgi:MSHA biogenesis protein MshP